MAKTKMKPDQFYCVNIQCRKRETLKKADIKIVKNVNKTADGKVVKRGAKCRAVSKCPNCGTTLNKFVKDTKC